MSVMETVTLRLTDDRRVTIDGLTTPASEVVKIRRRGQSGAIIAIKVPSHKYWSGLGQPWSNAPAEFQIFEYVSEKDHSADLERFIGCVNGQLDYRRTGASITLVVRSLVDVELRAQPIKDQPQHQRLKMRERHESQAVGAVR